MKKGKLISTIVVCIVLIVGGLILGHRPNITEHTSTTNIEIIEEMQIEGEVRRERIDSLLREVDSIRTKQVDVDSTTLDSMLRFLRGLKDD